MHLTDTRLVRRRTDAVVAAAGLGVLVAGMVAVRHGSVTAPERSAFRAVNDLPEALYPALWPLQQLGVVIVGPLVAVVAFATRRVRLGIVVLAATAAKLGSERVVKAFVSRQRPGTSIGGRIHLRGDVSRVGESFVSGHALLAGALATLVAPHLRGRWRYLPWTLLALVMLTRVYVGAHNPLDVVCGAALGVAIAGALNFAVGVPVGARHHAADPRARRTKRRAAPSSPAR